MDVEIVRQTWENVHNGHANVLDHGRSDNSRRERASLNYVPLEEWNRLCQDRQKRSWCCTMAELSVYSYQDIEALEGHEFEENREVRKAITWILTYIITLLFLNAFGVSSVLELFELLF